MTRSRGTCLLDFNVGKNNDNSKDNNAYKLIVNHDRQDPDGRFVMDPEAAHGKLSSARK